MKKVYFLLLFSTVFCLAAMNQRKSQELGDLLRVLEFCKEYNKNASVYTQSGTHGPGFYMHYKVPLYFWDSKKGGPNAQYSNMCDKVAKQLEKLILETYPD